MEEDNMPQERPLIFATQNAGKIREVSTMFPRGVKTLKDFGINSGANEVGSTFRENAVLKVREVLDSLPFDAVVIADDSGLEIDALDGGPGVHTRRWIGRSMTDREILDHCLESLAGVPLKERTARFRSVVAVGSKTSEIKTFEASLEGVILEEPRGEMREGFPFSPLFYVPEWGILLSDTYDMPVEQKAQYVTHRTRAFQQALPYVFALSE